MAPLDPVASKKAITEVVRASVLYSASALDLERVGCFLESQVSRFFLRNTQKPVVDRLLSGQPAQSASENAKKVVFGPGVLVRPRPREPFRYRKMRFTARRSTVAKACMN